MGCWFLDKYIHTQQESDNSKFMVKDFKENEPDPERVEALRNIPTQLFLHPEPGFTLGSR
jgi:hypothetical protein